LKFQVVTHQLLLRPNLLLLNLVIHSLFVKQHSKEVRSKLLQKRQKQKSSSAVTVTQPEVMKECSQLFQIPDIHVVRKRFMKVTIAWKMMILLPVARRLSLGTGLPLRMKQFPLLLAAPTK